MLRNFALLVAVSLASHASAVELVGTTHVDYYPEWLSSQFCCDGMASYKLQVNAGSVHIDRFSILDNTLSPVWSLLDVDAAASGLNVSFVAHAGVDYLKLDNFPGMETEINPDLGYGWHDFGPAWIAIPAGMAISTPEPSAIVLLMGSLAFLLKR